MKYRFVEDIDLFVRGRITSADASRQQRTAIEILRRFGDRPGIILADEVGMGKTFVALAVAASVALKDSLRRPVVVMVPPSLQQKWPRDFSVFREHCLPPKMGAKLTHATAVRAVEFLKLLDDPVERRKSIIFLTHGAMYRGLQDGWVKLAIIQRSLWRRRNTEALKRSLYRNAGSLLGMKWVQNRCPEIWEKLLAVPPDRWLRILQKNGIDPENDNNPATDDEPVPEMVINALQTMDVSEVYEKLKNGFPIRQTKHFNRNMKEFRNLLNDELRFLWSSCIREIRFELPLLVLDEAHHLKNPSTRFASLFQDKDAADDADVFSRGPLAGVFERMLFLTATPFQLGHHELCSVLNRFSGIGWRKAAAPEMGISGFDKSIASLIRRLDRAQEAAVQFEQSWAGLRGPREGTPRTDADLELWWAKILQEGSQEPTITNVLSRFHRAQMAMHHAEKELQPWVIRHIKPKAMESAGVSTPRRKYLVGRQIIDGHDQHGERGLNIDRNTILPFLLAARITTCEPDKRPVFAEGLASSYEAFLHTRQQNEKRNRDDEISFLDEDDEITEPSHISDKGVWYLTQLEELIPRNDRAASKEHPKICATVDRAIELWKRREKVLIFCHYVATGRALRRHLSDAMANYIRKTCSARLAVEPEEVFPHLETVGERFFDNDSPTRRACDVSVGSIIEEFDELLSVKNDILDIARRFIRTPSFLARYFPIENPRIDERKFQEILALPDDSGMAFGQVLRNFCGFLVNRCGTAERDGYLSALKSIQTGAIQGRDALMSYEDSEFQDLSGTEKDLILPNIRLVNGATKKQTRQTLMLTFNTPFFPEILVASSVMAEGVDLHLNCRYVLHHDLCWNPSTLEQRNGRVDRIGGKNEQCMAPIHVYFPFISETQDEKMYRVVMDRERWFKVVMGEKMTLDAKTTDKIAERLPLPESVAKGLAFDLEVARSASPVSGAEPPSKGNTDDQHQANEW
jgi:hypothetical protein